MVYHFIRLERFLALLIWFIKHIIKPNCGPFMTKNRALCEVIHSPSSVTAYHSDSYVLDILFLITLYVSDFIILNRISTNNVVIIKTTKGHTYI